MDNRSNGTFTRTVDFKYILLSAVKYSTEATESPMLHILETSYFDSDLIEKTRHVKLPPRSFSSQEISLKNYLSTKLALGAWYSHNSKTFWHTFNW
jgi:hypothetical protein